MFTLFYSQRNYVFGNKIGLSTRKLVNLCGCSIMTGISEWNVEGAWDVSLEVTHTEVQVGAMGSLKCRVKSEKFKVWLWCSPCLLHPCLRCKLRKVNQGYSGSRGISKKNDIGQVQQAWEDFIQDSCSRGARLNSTPLKLKAGGKELEDTRAELSVWSDYVFPSWHLSIMLVWAPKAWEIHQGSFWMITLQKDGSQVLENDMTACQTGRRLGEDLHLKGQRKNLQLQAFYSGT